MNEYWQFILDVFSGRFLMEGLLFPFMERRTYYRCSRCNSRVVYLQEVCSGCEYYLDWNF